MNNPPCLRIFDIFFVLFLVILSCVWIYFSFSTKEELKIEILENNRKLIVSPLDGKSQLWKVKNMIIEKGPLGVRVKESDCVKQICRHQGWIRSPGQVIICIPNRVTVRIVKKKVPSGDVDAISY